MSKSYRRRNRIDGQFAPRLIEMLRSPAFCALSRAAHQVLARIEIELADHGGMDNGKLPVTFDQFVHYGLHHNTIAPAIREVIALGFIEITEQGRAGNAEFRRPSTYRITYRHADRANPTHEWRRITEDEATMIAKSARRRSSNSACSKVKKPVLEKQKSTTGKRTTLQYGKRTENPVFHSTETGSTVHTTETGSTIDTLGVVVGEAAVDLPQAPPEPTDLVIDIPDFLPRRAVAKRCLQ